MLSVIMSSSSNQPFESGVAKGAVVEESQPRVLVSGDENVTSNVNLSSDTVDSDDRGGSRVSLHVDENFRVPGGDGSIVVDFRGSEEGRISEGVVEVNEFRVCEIKFEGVDEELKGVSGNAFTGEDVKVQSDTDDFDVKSNAGKDSVVNRKNDSLKESSSDYDSLLSMFDQYASNGKSEAVGYGYEIGDMVWGKVKSHPWWPGHIFNDAFASASVRRTKREGHVLVAFFGDSSYGWFDPAELIPFEPNFPEKSKQTNSRTFVHAVEEALEEVNRRQALGLVCRCRNQFNYRATDAEGYLSVDVGDYEPGFYSISQIKKARESFNPRAMFDFVKQLAVAPMSDEFGTLDLMKNKATVSVFRKAVFEEFDETYAQAFGAKPVRPVTPSVPAEPSRVPLSGRQVFADTLGKGKSSPKPNKLKDHSDKDKFLFKRRDEPIGSKTHKIARGQTVSSGEPPQLVGSVLPPKGMPPTLGDQANQTSVSRMAEVPEQSVSRPVDLEKVRVAEQGQDSVGGSLAAHTKLGEGSKVKNDSGKKKVKFSKRAVAELNLESSVPGEKIKKRKKQIAKESGELAGIGGEAPLEREVLGDNRHLKNLGNDDKSGNVFLPDIGTDPVVGDRNAHLQLPELLNDLRALALDPFLTSDSCYPGNLVQVFVRFRSLVYQKSLSSLDSAENELKEVRGTLPSPAVAHDHPTDSGREKSSVRPPKPSVRLEDPTKVGRKRGPSDRQEEMILKKKKKMSDLKALAAEKKAAQRAAEVRQGDGKEMSAKATAPTAEKKALSGDGKELPRKAMPTAPSKFSRSDSKRREPPAKVSEPTMLIMKFPPEAALPSPAELKVKFARYGPLDHSGTRIFWKSSTIRLVYLYKSDAQVALRYATSGSNLFGNTNVRCHLRELGAETAETESTKVEPNLGIPQPKDPPALRHRLGTNTAASPLPQAGQPKSILKKPPGEEGASTTGGNGNGNSRGRVKFMLDEVGGSVRTSSSDDAATSSSHGLNINSEKNHMVIPPSPTVPSIIPPVSSTQQFPPPIAPINYHRHTEFVSSRNVQSLSSPAALPPLLPTPSPSPSPSPSYTDISQQMISLLTKCKDVVNNLSGALGYVPYHPL
ncbi:OLC1v1000402C1 [Oldenlandia corymbosa var. corymbosa]|uniref:OLC1v1000402C1 n=1 Tax=Oldenlandia corymbosa var. corymbosa TaxID=529605 RepID=A0AAV1D5K2_OLDCO|nr:OLC1v1000402C1 [Oldenlandia corymbosa var. corymbosa]